MQAALSEAVGLGPLDRLLASRAVREVVVDGPSRILADVGGGLSPVSSFFSSPQAVQVTLRRLCTRAGRELGTGAVQELELPDGSQVQLLMPPLSPSGPLMRVSASGGTATPLTTLVASRQETGHLNPWLLRDGRHFVYTRNSKIAGNSGLWLGAVDAALDSQPGTRLLATSQGAIVAPGSDSTPDYVLFTRDGSLVAQAFDLKAAPSAQALFNAKFLPPRAERELPAK